MFKLNKLRELKGFTLVELLIVSTIMGILFSVGLAGYNNFNRRRIVREAALELLNNLRFAQEKALNGEKPSGCSLLNGWKLEFISGGYQIKAACTNGEFGTKDFSFSSGVSKTSGPSSFLFKVLAHGVKDGGEILLSGFGKNYKVKVTKSGEISDEGFQ